MLDLLTSLAPIAGSSSGRTLLGHVGQARSVVRLHVPGDPTPSPAALAGAHRWVRGLVPVPEVLEAREADPGAGLPGLFVTAHLDAVPGRQYLADGGDAEAMGRALGEVAARLSGVAVLAAGRMGPAGIETGPAERDGVDLVDAAQEAAAGLEDWSPALFEDLCAAMGDAQEAFDRAGRTSLVHGALGPRATLWDVTASGAGELRAVVGWDAVHAGHPLADLGSVLRTAPAVVGDAALTAWLARWGGDPDDVREQAGAADLLTLTRLASREERTSEVLEADAHLRSLLSKAPFTPRSS